MYCCGVRSTEARQLKCEDVHLNNGSLIESVLKQFRIILPVLIDDVRILVSYHLGLSMTGIALDRLHISPG